jgi:hypothetical protein
MNKLTCSTLAIFLTGSVALASDGEWNTLDHEINALASTLGSADGAPTVFGRVRTYYTSQADGGGVGTDTGGWSLANMRLGAKGNAGGYGYKVQTELSSGSPVLLDAYATFGIGDTMVGTFGQFKAGIARASRISSGSLLFRRRSMVGSAFSARTGGLMLGGEMSQMGWELSFMNGQDGTFDEFLIASRLSATIMGSGPGKVEGAYGGPEDPYLSCAIAFAGEADLFSEDSVVFEANSGTNIWSFDVASCTAGALGSDSSLGTAIAPDASPLSIQGSYMLQPGKWELAVRFQDFDNATITDDGTTRTDVAINNYINGHALKWMVNVQTDTEGANDNSEVTLGLQASF